MQSCSLRVQQGEGFFKLFLCTHVSVCKFHLMEQCESSRIALLIASVSVSSQSAFKVSFVQLLSTEINGSPCWSEMPLL